MFWSVRANSLLIVVGALATMMLLTFVAVRTSGLYTADPSMPENTNAVAPTPGVAPPTSVASDADAAAVVAAFAVEFVAAAEQGSLHSAASSYPRRSTAGFVVAELSTSGVTLSVETTPSSSVCVTTALEVVPGRCP